MSLDLALVDAANNCARDGATAILTLRSGAVVEGRLQQQGGVDLGTRHLRTETGWATVLVEEIATVEVRR